MWFNRNRLSLLLHLFLHLYLFILFHIFHFFLFTLFFFFPPFLLLFFFISSPLPPHPFVNLLCPSLLLLLPLPFSPKVNVPLQGRHHFCSKLLPSVNGQKLPQPPVMSGCCQKLLLTDFPVVGKVHQAE